VCAMVERRVWVHSQLSVLVRRHIKLGSNWHSPDGMLCSVPAIPPHAAHPVHGWDFAILAYMEAALQPAVVAVGSSQEAAGCNTIGPEKTICYHVFM
jgi:hypothetical protein